MEYVSQREFSKHIGRSHVWVNRLVKDGRLPSNNKGQIPLKAGLAAYEMAQQPGDDTRRAVAAEQRKEHAAKKTAAKKTAEKTAAKKTAVKTAPQKEPEQPPVVEDVPAPGEGMGVARINEAYNRARLAEKTYQAKLKELEYKEAQGLLVPVEDIKDDATKTGAEIRERLMSVPPRVAGVCEGKPAREIERIIEAAINEALEALQRSRFGK